MNTLSHPVSSGAWLDAADGEVAQLAAIVEAGRLAPAPGLAATLDQGIPVYDCGKLAAGIGDAAFRRRLLSEWHDVLEDGAGVFMLSGAWSVEADALDDVTAAFFDMIEREKASSSGGDHFAKAGANNRVWNALQKLALDRPRAFATYYANPWLALASEAWLGPGYQVTSQVNCVNPGGEAQLPHRDYHLGFCTAAQAAAYPRAVHRLSPHLTLQGAVAHVDMPVESGPTLLLPHSQKLEAGYLVAGRVDFNRLFDEHRAQREMRKGDAMFFNPALIHAAGANRSAGVRRIANLLQVSSAFGRAMESVDRLAMSRAVYPELLAAREAGRLDGEAAARAVAACAEGYAFPTNLDTDPPLGGLAPQSQQALMIAALEARWSADRYERESVARARLQNA